MAHGERAERNGHCGREYWSKRLRHAGDWGGWAKTRTHRAERRRDAELERAAAAEAEAAGGTEA